jgi:hypothetical protein
MLLYLCVSCDPVKPSKLSSSKDIISLCRPVILYVDSSVRLVYFICFFRNEFILFVVKVNH